MGIWGMVHGSFVKKRLGDGEAKKWGIAKERFGNVVKHDLT